MTTDRLFPRAHSAAATAGGVVDGGGSPRYWWSRRQGKQSCVVSSHVSGGWVPAGEHGICWHGTEFDVEWPLPVTAISEEHLGWPLVTSRLAAVTRAASC